MKVLRFIIYGNILVSLSVGILTYGISSFHELQTPILFSLCAFFATLFIYNLQRILRIEEVNMQSSDRHIWLSKNRWLIIGLSILGALGALTSYLMLGVTTDIYLVILLTLIGFLYAYRVRGVSALRDLPFLKIYLIGIVWSLVCAVWPIYHVGHWDRQALFISVSVFLFIIAATIPFDIRDLIYDDKRQKTIPQLIGVPFAKATGGALLVMSALFLNYVIPNIFLNPLYYLSHFGLLALILLVNEDRKEMFFSGLIDGWIIFLGLMYSYQAFL